MKYAWLLTHDYLNQSGDDSVPSRVGTMGPSNAPADLLAKLKAGEGLKWRCKDDDGEIYYAGRWICDEDMPDHIEYKMVAMNPGEKEICIVSAGLPEEAFGPLWDFCEPDAGAVTIQYRTPQKESKHPQAWASL